MSVVDRSQAYVYRGDRWTAPELKGMRMFAVRRWRLRQRSLTSLRFSEQRVCVRGTNGNMLVETESGVRLIVLGRQLRKVAR